MAAAGYVTVICNRPDNEIPPSHQAAAMKDAVESAGMTFHDLPLTHQTMTVERMQALADILENAGGPVLAYCASGTRSSVLWSLAQAMAGHSATEILAETQGAGYDLGHLLPHLQALSSGNT